MLGLSKVKFQIETETVICITSQTVQENNHNKKKEQTDCISGVLSCLLLFWNECAPQVEVSRPGVMNPILYCHVILFRGGKSRPICSGYQIEKNRV